MYIDSLHYMNVGPISKADIDFRRNEKGTPVPLIIVGRNGSGKSILLSNIVDAFYEIADKGYDNATQSTDNGHQYYKEIAPAQIKLGQKYMVSHICFQQEDSNIEYLFKSGKLSFEEYSKSREKTVNQKLNWQDASNYKGVTAEEKEATRIFEKDVICYFGPNRYIKPAWMGEKYHTSDNVAPYSLRPQYAKQLNNPISAVNIAELTLQWLFDVITDSRADLEKHDDGSGYSIVFPRTNDLDLLCVARNNVEKIMSEILGEDIIFRMGNRSSGKRRFSLRRKKDDVVLVPSLDALSTGQLALFNVFATIIRYADTDDINLSHKLSDITGIVVIDEIELHLHTQLQREVLPKLLALFPNIQFVVTSHSPLFLLGMREQFGEGGFDVIELPAGNRISVEQFSEFEHAYRFFAQTDKYHQEIKTAIDERKNRPLIITEGATDWKHMKAAYSKLVTDPRCSEWLSVLEFDFLEYEPENSPTENCYKLSMSGSQLKMMCEQYSLMQQPQKMIFVADADQKDIRNALGEKNKSYKSWGNNVYSNI